MALYLAFIEAINIIFYLFIHQEIGVSKKTGKPRKPEKKITEKTESKKKPIKPIHFLKKPAGSFSVL
jgi:hypothetical protein